MLICVPAGTVVREVIQEDGVPLRQCETRTITDLSSNSQKLLAAKGLDFK